MTRGLNRLISSDFHRLISATLHFLEGRSKRNALAPPPNLVRWALKEVGEAFMDYGRMNHESTYWDFESHTWQRHRFASHETKKFIGCGTQTHISSSSSIPSFTQLRHGINLWRLAECLPRNRQRFNAIQSGYNPLGFGLIPECWHSTSLHQDDDLISLLPNVHSIHDRLRKSVSLYYIKSVHYALNILLPWRKSRQNASSSLHQKSIRLSLYNGGKQQLNHKSLGAFGECSSHNDLTQNPSQRFCAGQGSCLGSV